MGMRLLSFFFGFVSLYPFTVCANNLLSPSPFVSDPVCGGLPWFLFGRANRKVQSSRGQGPAVVRPRYVLYLSCFICLALFVVLYLSCFICGAVVELVECAKKCRKAFM